MPKEPTIPESWSLERVLALGARIDGKVLKDFESRKRGRRSRRRKRGNRTVPKVAAHRDQEAALARYIGRPPSVPADCPEFRDELEHVSGTTVAGGGKGELSESIHLMGQGEVRIRRQVGHIKRLRTRRPYAVHRQQLEAGRESFRDQTDCQQREARKETRDEGIQERIAAANNRAIRRLARQGEKRNAPKS